MSLWTCLFSFIANLAITDESTNKGIIMNEKTKPVLYLVHHGVASSQRSADLTERMSFCQRFYSPELLACLILEKKSITTRLWMRTSGFGVF